VYIYHQTWKSARCDGPLLWCCWVRFSSIPWTGAGSAYFTSCPWPPTDFTLSCTLPPSGRLVDSNWLLPARLLAGGAAGGPLLATCRPPAGVPGVEGASDVIVVERDKLAGSSGRLVLGRRPLIREGRSAHRYPINRTHFYPLLPWVFSFFFLLTRRWSYIR
jgi:hypothetical protein